MWQPIKNNTGLRAKDRLNTNQKNSEDKVNAKRKFSDEQVFFSPANRAIPWTGSSSRHAVTKFSLERNCRLCIIKQNLWRLEKIAFARANGETARSVQVFAVWIQMRPIHSSGHNHNAPDKGPPTKLEANTLTMAVTLGSCWKLITWL